MMLKTHAAVLVENNKRYNPSLNNQCNFQYRLTQLVKFFNRSENKQYFTRIQNIRLPISFYNITTNNNTLLFNDDGVDYTITIPPGNYTLSELISEIQTLMNATMALTVYTITYSNITQKITITSDGAGGITTIKQSSIIKYLGFDANQTIPDGGSGTGNNVAYLISKHLKLQIANIVSNNLYSNDISNTTHVQPIGVNIPITKTRNEIEFYENNDGPLIKMSNYNSISSLNVKLLDEENNIIDLNNVPFSFEVIFYELNKML